MNKKKEIIATYNVRIINQLNRIKSNLCQAYIFIKQFFLVIAFLLALLSHTWTTVSTKPGAVSGGDWRRRRKPEKRTGNRHTCIIERQSEMHEWCEDDDADDELLFLLCLFFCSLGASYYYHNKYKISVLILILRSVRNVRDCESRRTAAVRFDSSLHHSTHSFIILSFV